jgi:Zn-dependent protease with chaperone function
MAIDPGLIRNHRKHLPWLLACAIAALSGCATNTITGRSQFMVVSEQQAINSSSAAYSRMMSGLSSKKKLETGTPRVARVHEITDRLIAQAVRFRPDAASWQWEVQVVDDPKTVNAFCMAGGKMGIYTGFWDKFHASDDEIAAVMGHEIGHALASHTREKMSVSMAAQVGATVAAAVIASRTGPGTFNSSNNAMQGAAALAVTLPNSREAEAEADQIGIELTARAGFDPRASVTLWQKMAKEGGRAPEFLSTHPSPDNRAEQLSRLVAKVEPLYLAAKAREGAAGTADVPPVPSFLGTEYVQKDQATITRQQYAERVAASPETMTFVSGPFEKFRRGESVFDCRFECMVGYGTSRGTWKELYDRKAWRDLAVAVLKVGYQSDLSYFLLAEAARGLGLKEAAQAYYARAIAAEKDGKGCAGLPDTCEGLEVKRLSLQALRR